MSPKVLEDNSAISNSQALSVCLSRLHVYLLCVVYKYILIYSFSSSLYDEVLLELRAVSDSTETMLL